MLIRAQLKELANVIHKLLKQGRKQLETELGIALRSLVVFAVCAQVSQSSPKSRFYSDPEDSLVRIVSFLLPLLSCFLFPVFQLHVIFY